MPRKLKAFLHLLAAGPVVLDDPHDDEPRGTEHRRAADNHKFLFPTYSISKIRRGGRRSGRMGHNGALGVRPTSAG